MKSWPTLIETIEGVTFERDKDLKKFSTMRLDARGDLITVANVEALKIVTKTLTCNWLGCKRFASIALTDSLSAFRFFI